MVLWMTSSLAVSKWCDSLANWTCSKSLHVSAPPLWSWAAAFTLIIVEWPHMWKIYQCGEKSAWRPLHLCCWPQVGSWPLRRCLLCIQWLCWLVLCLQESFRNRAETEHLWKTRGNLCHSWGILSSLNWSALSSVFKLVTIATPHATSVRDYL